LFVSPFSYYSCWHANLLLNIACRAKGKEQFVLLLLFVGVTGQQHHSYMQCSCEWNAKTLSDSLKVQRECLILGKWHYLTPDDG